MVRGALLRPASRDFAGRLLILCCFSEIKKHLFQKMFSVVRGEGVEPPLTGSEPGVLPLDEPRSKTREHGNIRNVFWLVLVSEKN